MLVRWVSIALSAVVASLLWLSPVLAVPQPLTVAITSPDDATVITVSSTSIEGTLSSGQGAEPTVSISVTGPDGYQLSDSAVVSWSPSSKTGTFSFVWTGYTDDGTYIVEVTADQPGSSSRATDSITLIVDLPGDTGQHERPHNHGWFVSQAVHDAHEEADLDFSASDVARSEAGMPDSSHSERNDNSEGAGNRQQHLNSSESGGSHGPRR